MAAATLTPRPPMIARPTARGGRGLALSGCRSGRRDFFIRTRRVPYLFRIRPPAVECYLDSHPSLEPFYFHSLPRHRPHGNQKFCAYHLDNKPPGRKWPSCTVPTERCPPFFQKVVAFAHRFTFSFDSQQQTMATPSINTVTLPPQIPTQPHPVASRLPHLKSLNDGSQSQSCHMSAPRSPSRLALPDPHAPQTLPWASTLCLAWLPPAGSSYAFGSACSGGMTSGPSYPSSASLYSLRVN